MDSLEIVENVNAADVFSGNGLDNLLGKIEIEATSILPDVSTAKGRREIASMAAKVSKSKTYLDGLGKTLVSDWKTKAKAVDSERKKMRDTLDALKAEVRAPLTEWEAAEKDRIEEHERGLIEISSTGNDALNNWIDENLPAMLKHVESFSVDDFEEYATDAAKAKDAAVTQIKQAIEKREAYDKEQAELEKLRAEAEARAKADEEERLRKEGEERARLEAEKAAKDEADRVTREAEKIEREKQAAIQAQQDAELRAKQAEENASKEAERAAQAERDRIEQERINEEIAAKKREADKTHKKKINNSIVDALVIVGVSQSSAQKAVIAIAKGEVPHTRISY